MLVTDLKGFISRMYKDEDKVKTVLVEGKWGCGKTYVIRDFLISRKGAKTNIIYISLFGLSSQEEVLLHLAEKLDSSTIANFGNSFVVRPSLKEMPYNNTLIIFDDIERVDEKLSFSSIYGIVNSLMMLGFKVICVSCFIENRLTDDYTLFKDKAFELSFVVDADKAACEKMLNNEIEITDSILEGADENLRSLKRAKICYDRLMKQIKERNINNFFETLAVSENLYFEYIVLAERCYYSSNKDSPEFNEKTNEFAQISYNEDVRRFKSRLIANEIYTIKETRSDLSIEKVRDIIDFLRTGSFDDYFAKYFFDTVEDNKKANEILRVEPFLLDDNDKKKYIKKFLSSIKEFDFDSAAHRNALFTFLRNSVDKIGDDEKEKLVDVLATKLSKQAEEEIIDHAYFAKENEALSNFLAKLRNVSVANRTSKRINEILKMVSKNNYSNLLGVFRESNYSTDYSKIGLLSALEKKNFGLPDLSKTIDYPAWSYCHEIAKFVSNTNYEKSFVDALGKQCLENPSSVSVREKCNALVKYNLNGRYGDFFERYPLISLKPKVKA